MAFLAAILVWSKNIGDCFAYAVLPFMQYNRYSLLMFINIALISLLTATTAVMTPQAPSVKSVI